MSTDTLSLILRRLKPSAGVFVHASFRGAWAVDTSGQRMATFHLIQRGNSWLHMHGREPRALHPGDLLVLPRDAEHIVSSSAEVPDPQQVNSAEGVATEDADNLMLCGFFEFQGRAAWPLLDALPDAVVIDRQDPHTRRLIELIIVELEGAPPGTQATLEVYAIALFVQVLRAAMEGGWCEGLLGALADVQIAKALAAIHENPATPWSLQDLAARAGLGRTAFAQRFRDLTGVTPANYLSQWRMQVATDLLTGTDDSILAIAEAVGYDSEPAFRKAFRRETGRPPGEVRRGSKL
ncbi:MAG: AraC family transcriptional regulator [Pseudomonadota bacterium]